MKVTLRALPSTSTSVLTLPPLALSLLGRLCVAELLIFIRVSNYIGSPATVSAQLLLMLWACSFNSADSYDFVSSPLKAAPCILSNGRPTATRWAADVADVASSELGIFNLIKKSRRPSSSSWPQCNCTASILIKVSTRIHLPQMRTGNAGQTGRPPETATVTFKFHIPLEPRCETASLRRQTAAGKPI